jgi:hypothetical protein
MKTRQAAIGVALILGVSNLNADHYGLNIPGLQSPEKDVKDYELIAKLKGFQVQVMTNEDADRKKLFFELSKAAKTLKEGDFFLLTFSASQCLLVHARWSNPPFRDAASFIFLSKRCQHPSNCGQLKHNDRDKSSGWA